MPPRKSRDKPKIEHPPNMLPERSPNAYGAQSPHASGAQASYASGGQAPYASGGQAPYASGGQASYPAGAQVPYDSSGQAPPFPYGAAHLNPFRAGSTSQGRSLAMADDDPNKAKWHDLRCEDCNKLIGQVPIIGDSRLIRESRASGSGRLKKTVWIDSKTKKEVATVYPGPQGPCEWHGGGM